MVCWVLMSASLIAGRAFGNKLTSLRHAIVAKQLRTKFSRASVSAAKECTGTARDVEMLAMADVKRIPNDVKNVGKVIFVILRSF